MEISGRNFLVTGGSGFIGSHVVDQLLDAGAKEVAVFDKSMRRENLARAAESDRLRLVEGDVTDRAALGNELTGVHGLFHLAVLPIGPCDEHPRLCFEVNVGGTFNVLEAAHEAGVEKVVFSSASSVYGDTLETMDESHPLEARSLYGATKIAGEYFLRAFRELYGLDYVILRYMNVYGPRQDGGLVINVLRRIRSGEAPTIMGDGSQSFDFVHVADVAGANIAAMASDVSGEAFNVGSGGEVTVRQIVDRLLVLSGSDLKPDVRADAKVPMTRRVGTNTRARDQLGWQPAHDLETGLKDVIEAA